MKELTEKECLLEIEKNVRFVMQYEMDDDFVKHIRTTVKCVLTKLDEIRKRKTALKEKRDADNYAKQMGIRR